MRRVLDACAADLPGCDDTADLLGDRADLVLLFAAAVAVIVVIAIVLDRMLRCGHAADAACPQRHVPCGGRAARPSR